MSLCYRCMENIQGNSHYGLHPTCFTAWFDCSPQESFLGLTPKEAGSTEVDANEIASSFLHGRFKKYTASLAGKRFILKVVQHEYPHLPSVEYVCNRLAEFLKLKVPDYYFVEIDGQHCFVSRNFLDEGSWQKLTHIYHYVAGSREYNVQRLSEVIFDVTRRPQDVEQFYRMILFDALIGNHDRHGRNLGILSSGKKNRLSPIYDNPSYIGVENLLEADLNPTGAVRTEASDAPTMKDYVIELKRLKANKLLKQFRKHCDVERIGALVDESFLDPKVKKAMKRLVSKRAGELYETI